MTPQIKHDCQGKIYLSKSKMTLNNKISVKKKYFTISYTKHARFYLSLPISITVTIFTVSAFMFLTLTPHIPILFTAIPYLIISLIHYIVPLQSLLVICAAMPL